MSEKKWYVGIRGRRQGPFSVEEIKSGLDTGEFDAQTLVFAQGMESWQPLAQVPQLSGLLQDHGSTVGGPPPLPGSGPQADEIDYFIHGEEMQFVEVELDPGESAVAEAGGMMYMTSGVTMETIFGDGRASQKAQGMMDKLWARARGFSPGSPCS